MQTCRLAKLKLARFSRKADNRQCLRRNNNNHDALGLGHDFRGFMAVSVYCCVVSGLTCHAPVGGTAPMPGSSETVGSSPVTCQRSVVLDPRWMVCAEAVNEAIAAGVTAATGCTSGGGPLGEPPHRAFAPARLAAGPVRSRHDQPEVSAGRAVGCSLVDLALSSLPAQAIGESGAHHICRLPRSPLQSGKALQSPPARRTEKTGFEAGGCGRGGPGPLQRMKAIGARDLPAKHLLPAVDAAIGTAIAGNLQPAVRALAREPSVFALGAAIRAAVDLAGFGEERLIAMNAQARRVLLFKGRIVPRTRQGTHCHGLLRFHNRTTVLVGDFRHYTRALRAKVKTRFYTEIPPTIPQ